MKWEVVIGLETHAQLSTASKIFSAASTAFGAAPNTQACAVDLALPGVLPVLNKGAVERAVRFGLAVGAKINRRSIFARKNYFYPDLPKGYQISQYELPIVEGGSLTIHVGAQERTVQLTRAHLEEDAGKSLHEDFHGATGIDLNRAGTPLLEIVTEPDMRSSAEAVAYAKALHALVRWIGICDGNMQEGSFRCDANVSVRPLGTEKLGTRFEIRRQIEVIEDGGKIVQETRLYDPDKDETRSMRSKEDAHDYRYFPDPDLLPLAVSEATLEEMRAALPELPAAKQARFATSYGVNAYDAAILTSSRELADYFEACVRGADAKTAKLCANWITGQLNARLNDDNLDISQSKIDSAQLRRLVDRVADGAISGNTAKSVFDAIWAGEAGSADAADIIIKNKGLQQISDFSAIEKIVDEVLATNAQQVADYKAGKEKAFNSLVGQAMKATKGKANPQQVNEILKRKLAQ
jgi:aspartyl-tRNA(Asn)/glutamyl-tRNA(Gln) amidotransferase subunit B